MLLKESQPSPSLTEETTGSCVTQAVTSRYIVCFVNIIIISVSSINPGSAVILSYKYTYCHHLTFICFNYVSIPDPVLVPKSLNNGMKHSSSQGKSKGRLTRK